MRRRLRRRRRWEERSMMPWQPSLWPWERGCKHDERQLRAVRGEGEISTWSNPERLCTSLTNDRNPCNGRRFGWTRFWWHPQPWPEIGLSTAIALFVGVNATWFIALRGQQWTREAVRSLEEATNVSAHPTRRFEIPSLQADERVLIGAVSYGKGSHDK